MGKTIVLDTTIHGPDGRLTGTTRQEFPVGQAAEMLALWMEQGLGQTSGARMVRERLAVALGMTMDEGER